MMESGGRRTRGRPIGRIGGSKNHVGRGFTAKDAKKAVRPKDPKDDYKHVGGVVRLNISPAEQAERELRILAEQERVQAELDRIERERKRHEGK